MQNSCTTEQFHRIRLSSLLRVMNKYYFIMLIFCYLIIIMLVLIFKHSLMVNITTYQTHVIPIYVSINFFFFWENFKRVLYEKVIKFTCTTYETRWKLRKSTTEPRNVIMVSFSHILPTLFHTFMMIRFWYAHDMTNMKTCNNNSNSVIKWILFYVFFRHLVLFKYKLFKFLLCIVVVNKINE